MAAPRRALAATAVTLLAALVAGPGAATAASAAARAAATAGTSATAGTTLSAPADAVVDGLELTLRSVSPTVATPGAVVTVVGTMRNTSAQPVPRPRVRVVAGSVLQRRTDVAAWADGTSPATGREVGSQQLGADLPGGASTTFAVRVSGLSSLQQTTYGVLPLSVEVGRSVLRTFAAYQSVKQYAPLTLSYAVPLTLDPQPALFGASGEQREAAWSTALGAGSRLDRLLTATERAPVTWALDPGLVPGTLEEATGAGPLTPLAGASTEQTLRTTTERRIADAAAAHGPWVLPDTDADVAAAASVDGGARPLVGTLVRRAGGVAGALRGRADVVWPADQVARTDRTVQLRSLYAGQGPAALVAAQSSLAGSAEVTADAGRKTADGMPVLAYDDELSRLFARAAEAADAAAPTQQFVAEALALLNESPGLSRSVFVVAPRALSPQPSSVTSFFATTSRVPWLVTAGTQPLFARAAASSPAAGRASDQPTPTPSSPATAPTDPSDRLFEPGASLLTRAGGAVLERTLTAVNGLAQVREDGAAFKATWTRSVEELASSRWRRSPEGFAVLLAGITAETTATTRSVRVAPGTINFLADSGRLQITVVNDLDVAVNQVKLNLSPANPRLRIDTQPGPLRIGAKSRATVVVQVTGLAAGPVPITTTLTTPDGTIIGQGAEVTVRVTPTGDWIYWSLGAVAATILVLGIWRQVRRGAGTRRALAHQGET